jgi:hypothetical protein
VAVAYADAGCWNIVALVAHYESLWFGTRPVAGTDGIKHFTIGQRTTKSSLLVDKEGRQNDDSSHLSRFELGIQGLIWVTPIDTPRSIHTRLDLAEFNAQILHDINMQSLLVKNCSPSQWYNIIHQHNLTTADQLHPYRTPSRYRYGKDSS